MRVVLLNSPVVARPTDSLQRTWAHPRIGVASLAGFLRSHGCDVHVLDPHIEKLNAAVTAERILAHNPACVGLPAFTEEIHSAALIAETVKKHNPRITTVIGGCHVSALPAETLAEFLSFDIGVVGEGELPLLDLVTEKPLAGIPGIVFRDSADNPVVTAPRDDVLPLDTLPIPAWDLYDVGRYGFPLSIELARCCPFACAFCFKSVGRRPRYKSPEKALDEIEYCITHYGVREFYFSSNGTYPLDKQHAMRLCAGIKARGLRIEWDASTRVDVLDEELIALMRESGCRFIDFGIESGDPEVLRHCGKGTDLGITEKTIRLCHGAGIETELNFILGLPYETPESIENTRRFAAKLRNCSTVANFAILTPFPGTKVHDMAARHEGGLRLKTKDWRLYTKQGGAAIVHDNFAEGELRKYQGRLYLSYYLTPRKILQLLTSRNAMQLLDLRRALHLLRQFR